MGLSWEDMDEQFWGNALEYLPINNAPEMKTSRKTRKIGETFQWALNTNLEDLQELTESKSATKNFR